MKEPDNYSELLQSVRAIAEHCEATSCKDCPFCIEMEECVLHIEIPFNWLLWFPPDERSEEE